MANSEVDSSAGDPLDLPPAPRRTITFASVLLGTVFSGLIAGLAPYNDFVVGNGFLIGCYLPVGFVLCMFALVVGVNAPLRRWMPGRALSSGELAIVTVMMLVACSIPCQGLLRSFLPVLVHPFRHGQENAAFWKAFSALGLPDWLFPVDSVQSGRDSLIVRWFYSRVPAGEAIPYRAWIGPLAVWGIFFVSLFTTLIASAFLIYPQWSKNERLAFPIAQVELALIDEPTRGRALNALFRSRVFWIGAAFAFLLQNLVVLHLYFPKHAPNFTLTFDFKSLLTAEPWIWLPSYAKKNTLYFLFVGMAYFIQSRVAFSIWAIFWLMQALHLLQQTHFQYDQPLEANQDQHLGASLVFIAGVFWVGRHYWWRVVRGALGEFRIPVLALALGLLGMTGWLKIMGMSWWMAGLLIAMMLLAHLTAARVVAETGLPIFRGYANAAQIFTRFDPSLFSGRDVYFAQVFTQTGGSITTRESAMTFGLHGLWVFDAAAGAGASSKRSPSLPLPPVTNRRWLGVLIGWALLVSFVVGCASFLHNYYTYLLPLTQEIAQRADTRKINPHGVDYLQKITVANPLTQHAAGRFTTPAHRPALHMVAGAVITGVLSFLSLRYVAWPFMPVGYVIATTNFIELIWYSVMLGWLCKVLVLRLGGARLFQAGKPLFIGLIVGEALTAGIWLMINVALASAGMDYRPVILYPS